MYSPKTKNRLITLSLEKTLNVNAIFYLYRFHCLHFSNGTDYLSAITVHLQFRFTCLYIAQFQLADFKHFALIHTHCFPIFRLILDSKHKH